MASPSTDRRFGSLGTLAIKAPCKVAVTVGSLTLSGEGTFDGVACISGDRVLATSQIDGTQNGIWIVDTGSWTRAPDWNNTYDITQGTMIKIISGTSAHMLYEVTTANPITIGTTAITITGNSASAIGTVTFYGNVGIGITPTTKLDLWDASNAIATISGDASVSFVGSNYSNTSNPFNHIFQKYRGTRAAPLTASTGDVSMNITARAYDGTTVRNITQIRGAIDTLTGTNDVSGTLTFGTRPDGASAAVTDRMQINKLGNIGIGTPFSPLNAAGYTDITIFNATNGAILRCLSPNLLADGRVQVVNSGMGIGSYSNVPVSMAVNGTEVFRFDTAQNALVYGAGGLGYGTGVGANVTQATSRATAVTINKATGSITMFSAAGSATWGTFVVNNSVVAATDVVLLSIKVGATNIYNCIVHNVTAGAFTIAFATTGGVATDAPVINFAVIKAVNA